MKGEVLLRRKFLKIVSAATTIALALTIGVCSAAAEDDAKISAGSTVDPTGENAKLIITSNEYAEKFEQIYEEVLEKEVAEIEDNFMKYEPQIMDGIDPYAQAREKAEKIAQEECEKLGLYTEYLLTPMENVSYIGWQGNFPVEDIEDSQLTFRSPNSFTCTSGNRTAKITARNDFSANLKRASVNVTYDNGATSSNSANGNSIIVSTTATPKIGTITKGTYSLYMYNGNGSGSGLYEVAFITLHT